MVLLIITADDFGVNEARSRGIIALARDGKLSHTTALVNGEVSKQAIGAFVVARAECHGDRTFMCTIGLHFNITEGFPLSPEARQCSVLVDPISGRFRGKSAVFLSLSHLSRADGDAYVCVQSVIEAELAAQMGAFREYMGAAEAAVEGGFTPLPQGEAHVLWVDGHHHVHVLPIVLEAMLSFNRRHARDEAPRRDGTVSQTALIGGVRMPCQGDLQMEGNAVPSNEGNGSHLATSSVESMARYFFASEEDCFGEPFWRRVSSLGGACAALLSSGDVPIIGCPDGFFGLNIMGSACSAERVHHYLNDALQRGASMEEGVPCPSHRGVVEVMTHAGHAYAGAGDDIFYHDVFSKSPERDHELAVYRDIVLPAGVEMVNCDVAMEVFKRRAVLSQSVSHAPSTAAGNFRGLLERTSRTPPASLHLVEAAEAEARANVEHAEGVGINAILSAEVGAFLAYSRKIQQINRSGAKAAAHAATGAHMAATQEECEHRLVRLDEEMSAMLSEVRDTFTNASDAVMRRDEGVEVREALISNEREAMARAISNGRAHSYTKAYLA